MNRFKKNRRNGLNVLEDDAGHFKEEEDVYDLVDNEEYKNLVESRRQREDFVVDDGTLRTEILQKLNIHFSFSYSHFHPISIDSTKRRHWLL